MKKYITPVFMFLALYAGCKEDPPVGPESSITLSVVDTDLTEVRLKVETENINLPSLLRILRDNIPVKETSIDSSGAVITIDSLQPSNTYNFQAAIYDSDKEILSNIISVSTLDTTSQNFTLQKYNFGGAASSYLSDVAIVNDTSIWAVGAIYINDSTGQVDPIPYNAVHWDGKKWELKKIRVNFRGEQITPLIEGAFAFSITDIWFVGSLPIHGNGENWVIYDLRTSLDPNLSLSKTWGISSNNIYFAGRGGSIAHYQNGKWQKVESGTNLDINDIWGAIDKDGKEVVLCTAYNLGTGGEKKLLKIKDNKVDTIQWVENRELYTVWFNNLDKIYAGGEGLFARKNGVWKQEELPALFKFRVRGNELNDIWTCGGFGFAAHFNGSTWKVMEEAALTSGNYYSLDVKGNIVALVGSTENSALITIGKRIN